MVQGHTDTSRQVCLGWFCYYCNIKWIQIFTLCFRSFLLSSQSYLVFDTYSKPVWHCCNSHISCRFPASGYNGFQKLKEKIFVYLVVKIPEGTQVYWKAASVLTRQMKSVNYEKGLTVLTRGPYPAVLLLQFSRYWEDQ